MSYASLGLALAIAGCVLGQSPETVKQEDLVAHYERYNGSRLIVSGQVVSGLEMAVMYLRGSSTVSDAPAGMLITFSKALSAKPDTLAKRYLKALKKAGRVDAVLGGQFEGAADRKWGHQLCCRFRFDVDRVMGVK